MTEMRSQKKASSSLPAFERKNAKQIQYKRQYQNEKDQGAQFEVVGELDKITREAGKFIKWSDLLDIVWD